MEIIVTPATEAVPPLSYVTLFDADQYMQYHLKKRFWDSQDVDQKLAALYSATVRIDRLNFIGEKAVRTQSLSFPRLGQIEVPAAIKEAEIELAISLLEGIDPEQELNSIAEISETYGTLKQVKSPQYVGPHISAGIPSVEAWVRLVPFLVVSNKLTLTIDA